MRTLRALGALLPFALVASTVLVGAAPAAAQEPSVNLTLRAQTPVTTLEQPEVTITFRAENLGPEALAELSVTFVVGPAITSRGQYTTALAAGPGSLPIGGNTEEQSGTLDPGATREFSVTIDLGEFGGVSDSDSAVPVR